MLQTPQYLRIGDWVCLKYPTVRIIDYLGDDLNFLLTGDSNLSALNYEKQSYMSRSFSADQFTFPITGPPFEIEISERIYIAPYYPTKQDPDGTKFHKKIDGHRCKVVIPKTFKSDGRYYLVCQDKGRTFPRQAEISFPADVADLAMGYIDTVWESSHFCGKIIRAYDVKTRKYYDELIPPHSAANTMVVVTLPNYIQWWVNSYHLKKS